MTRYSHNGHHRTHEPVGAGNRIKQRHVRLTPEQIEFIREKIAAGLGNREVVRMVFRKFAITVSEDVPVYYRTH